MKNFTLQNEKYKELQEKIIKSIEDNNCLAWRKVWKSGKPQNFITKKDYRGFNYLSLMLSDQNISKYWITEKQIKEKNGKLKEGATAENIIYCVTIFKNGNEYIDFQTFNKLYKEGNKNIYKYFINKLSQVYNLGYVEGIKTDEENITFNPIEEAEKIINGYKDKPEMIEAGDRAYYQPLRDLITLPPKGHFIDKESFYSVYFHELIHSTGHQKRLYREGIISLAEFGSVTYSREELVAEMGSAFLSSDCNISDKTISNQTSYVKGWLKALKEDPYMIQIASRQAEQAISYIKRFNNSK